VAILPDLVWSGREPSVELVRLEGQPTRTVFTSVRDASKDRPTILACRSILNRSVAFL